MLRRLAALRQVRAALMRLGPVVDAQGTAALAAVNKQVAELERAEEAPPDLDSGDAGDDSPWEGEDTL